MSTLFWTTHKNYPTPVIKETAAYFMTGGTWGPRVRKSECSGRFSTKEEAQTFCDQKKEEAQTFCDQKDAHRRETVRLLKPHQDAIDKIKADRWEEFQHLFKREPGQ